MVFSVCVLQTELYFVQRFIMFDSFFAVAVFSIPIHFAAVVVRILNKIGRANTCIRSDVIFLDLKPLVYHGFM